MSFNLVIEILIVDRTPETTLILWSSRFNLVIEILIVDRESWTSASLLNYQVSIS